MKEELLLNYRFAPCKMFNGIDTKDYLNLALVGSNIKPAAFLGRSFFEPSTYKMANYHICSYFSSINKFDVIYSMKFKDRGIVEIDGTDVNFGLNISFIISKDKETLSKLSSPIDHYLYGTLLGYPNEDIVAYANKKISGEKVEKNMLEALDKNMKIPGWIAYLSHIPAKFDVVNNEYSRGSVELGEKYMEFARSKYPALAEKIESDFKELYNPKRLVRMPILDLS